LKGLYILYSFSRENYLKISFWLSLKGFAKISLLQRGGFGLRSLKLFEPDPYNNGGGIAC
tara:strand:- start:1496 stop:1675 length:180 start_codon:yes stop_codon:yes gene_type:complete